MLLNKKGQNYADFNMMEGWAMVQIDNAYYQHRRKIPDELRNKRDSHIRRMYNEGTPMAWIAKFYQCSRVHVLRIIKG
jgi:Mor family transcriptional regulator